jgi:hypothetical protein
MTEPRTAAGRDAVRMRGLFGGETEERAAQWVALIEAEAASPDSEALRAALERIAYADEFSTLDGSFDRNNIRKYARAALTPGSRG